MPKTNKKVKLALNPLTISKMAKEAKKEFPYKTGKVEFFLMGKSKFVEYLENSFPSIIFLHFLFSQVLTERI